MPRDRFEGYVEFCAAAVAGEVFHMAPVATDMAQRRALTRD